MTPRRRLWSEDELGGELSFCRVTDKGTEVQLPRTKAAGPPKAIPHVPRMCRRLPYRNPRSGFICFLRWLEPNFAPDLWRSGQNMIVYSIILVLVRWQPAPNPDACTAIPSRLPRRCRAYNCTSRLHQSTPRMRHTCRWTFLFAVWPRTARQRSEVGTDEQSSPVEPTLPSIAMYRGSNFRHLRRVHCQATPAKRGRMTPTFRSIPRSPWRAARSKIFTKKLPRNQVACCCGQGA